MKLPVGTVCLALLLSGATMVAPYPAACQDRAARMIHKFDRDGDGRIGRQEWTRRPARFGQLDTNGDGYLSPDELRAGFAEGDGQPAGGGGKSAGTAGGSGGAMLDGQTTRDALDEETLCALARSRRCDIGVAVKRGLFETGLHPVFPEGAGCRDIDERWAIDYGYKRDRRNYHGGIDMPAPFGTPIVAAAAGTVVGVFEGRQGMRGIEIVLRHGPEDTGLPVWTYTEYAHLEEMPKLKPGDRVRMGEVVGLTGNSGTVPGAGRAGKQRRPAIHFAVWFSASPNFVALRRVIVPVKGDWMDPNALYRGKPPFDSYAMKALPAADKGVRIPVMFEDGSFSPPDTKVIWPYRCGKR